jgi:hypothetical protein
VIDASGLKRAAPRFKFSVTVGNAKL